jgi:hypothetical protein
MVGGDWSNVVNKGRQEDVNWTEGIKNLLELDLFDYSNVTKFIENVDIDHLGFIALTRKLSLSAVKFPYFLT